MGKYQNRKMDSLFSNWITEQDDWDKSFSVSFEKDEDGWDKSFGISFDSDEDWDSPIIGHFKDW